MPKGPDTYGSQVGRPKKKKRKRKMNESQLELFGESMVNAYRNIAYLLLGEEEESTFKKKFTTPGSEGTSSKAAKVSSKLSKAGGAHEISRHTAKGKAPSPRGWKPQRAEKA